jgi:hypothetical protein
MGWDGRILRWLMCVNPIGVNVTVKKSSCSIISFHFHFENVHGSFGLITEKIFDCFAAGTVPIYYGTSNISDYIPESCYVDFSKFKDYDLLYTYLTEMSEEEHKAYLLAAKRFIETPAYQEFTSRSYVDVVIGQLHRLEARPPFKRSLWKVKRTIIALMLQCPHFFSRMRRFYRMKFDLIIIR